MRAPSRFPFRLYNAALLLGAPLILSYYGWRTLRHGKYLAGLKERLGFLPDSARSVSARHADSVVIWLHCVSVGETLAARPLALALREALPNAKFFISTTTETGQARAREQLAWMDGHSYFPLDFPGVALRALRAIRPSVVIILETEIWPNFLRACTKHSIPVALVNGRISDRSFHRYARLGSAMADLLNRFAGLLMQSEDDARRICALGAPPGRVKTLGNLKYAAPDAAERARQDAVAAALDAQFGLSETKHLIICGSAVEGEEEPILAAFRRVRQTSGLEDARLLLAPRHPQRFAQVAAALARQELPFARRTQADDRARRAPLLLLDSIGELAAAYRFAGVAFVGGSLVPRGGHSILEPAAAARPVVTGPHTENFRDVMATFRAANAVIELAGGGDDEIAETFIALLRNRDDARALGERARRTFQAHGGAADRAAREILAILGR